MARRSFELTLALVLGLLAGCASQERRGVEPGRPHLFDGMGRHTRTVTTDSARAQQYFNQGLVWAYAFNHDEAIRSFTEAARLDPNCAMAWWGVALCNGPHINNTVVPEARGRAAWEALQKAQTLRQHANPTEQALIDALAQRYADPPPSDRAALDQAYADAMREVWHAHRNDTDIGTLYAEALMDLQPWDLWTAEGEPKGVALEVVAVLEHVLALDPHHPGATHLYIHAVEASPYPERAIAAADVLRTAVPIAGHLVHMPAHIDVRVGKWQSAADQNVAAIAADRRYRQIVPKQGFYHLYMAHNHHFLAWASMMEGRNEAALKAAREMVAGVPPEFIESDGPVVDTVAGITFEVLMRFGRWDDVLAEPEPPAALPITRALWRFARGIAYAAKGQVEDALAERKRFQEAVALVPEGAMMATNPASNVLAIADHMLAGEILFRRGRIDEAAFELRKAVALEDRLRYMEPPDWIQPVRHTLGAVLTAGGRYGQAEAVYREDLKRWPENGWALYGLAQCLKARGADEEAAAVEARFARAWSRADTKISSSCLCVSRAE
ncbi:MAG: tetratricopeptide repeat protein [Phycisphaerae bacterium]|nr:tetratricopeptide repeat protein [Phycisphaerae bacterium]MCZ2399768.1 tetratricopeptide repeat protein [Phycisphaerae bacterium]NUQ48597.1 tetratricopeptide repeat protein [Phycisphaerae bacterium]